MSDAPILPCHPPQCLTCKGTDWDGAHNVTCADPSWCQAYKGAASFGFYDSWYICDLALDHDGKHVCGAVTW